MEELKNKILREGRAIGTQIVKVDGFINHQIDVAFMEKVGKEFARRFDCIKVDKILTVEASGIAIACLTAPFFGYPRVVFAKKTKPSTMTDEFYGAEAKSFTKNTVSMVRVSKEFINPGDRVLILDDFMAHGEAATALTEVVEQACAKVEGVGIVIEKAFQGGGEKLRRRGYRVESLAIVEKIVDGNITFKNE
ncbi:MAG: xanthine phosphoribosyltransferase [Anaerovoracaceae bacterium]|jgi:xanthine phosphoribosyltransferase